MRRTVTRLSGWIEGHVWLLLAVAIAVGVVSGVLLEDIARGLGVMVTMLLFLVVALVGFSDNALRRREQMGPRKHRDRR